MNLNDFIEKFAELFDETDINEFAAETVYKDLDEWSSLIALSVIAMVDEEFDVAIGAKEIMGNNTIEDLYKTIVSKRK